MTRLRSLTVTVFMTAVFLLACEITLASDPVSRDTGAISSSIAAKIYESLVRIEEELPEELEGCSFFADSAKGDGETEISMVVRLRCNGFETLEVTRTVTVASAAAQARAMARELVETAEERAAMWEASAAASLEGEVFKAAPPVPTGPYSRRKALGLSFCSTLFPIMLGVPLMITGFYYDDLTPVIVVGAVLTTLGVSLGPSTGYFYLRRYAHGWGLGVGRFFMLGGSVGLGFLALLSTLSSDKWLQSNCEGDDGEDCSHNNDMPKVFLAFAIMSATATLVTAFVDAALVGRAADKKNGAARANIMMLPAPVLTGERRFVPGLVLSGRF